MDLEILRWEKTRLSLKIRTVDGSALVRDKRVICGILMSSVRSHGNG